MKSVLIRILDFVAPTRVVYREARRKEAERFARVEKFEAEWRVAHPDLVAQGCPPPPTSDSMMRIGVRFMGVFYQP